MPNKIKFSVSGINEMLTKLQQLEKNVDLIIKEALKSGIKPVIETMKELAPERTGALKEAIQETEVYLDGTAYKISGGIIWEQWPGPHVDHDNPELFYVVFQEFGTVNHPPRPFIYPAYVARKKEAVRNIKAELKKGLGLK